MSPQTLPASVTERDVSLVDLATAHDLRDGECACGDFAGSSDDHRRHLGATVVAEADRIVARVFREYRKPSKA
jgi:hypothetical protein